MLNAAAGLTEVPIADLRKALSALHRGWLECPLTPSDLARVGLQHCSDDLLGTLRGLDAPGVRAVLVAVIAERMPQNRERKLRAQMRSSG